MKPNLFLLSGALLSIPASPAQTTANLQAYWDFEGNAANNSAALGGSAFNGTLLGGVATTGAAVKVGTGSLNLDGVNDYMNVATSVNVNEPWTVSAWFRPDISPAGTTRMMVYESRGSYAMSYGLREGTSTADTNFQLFNQRTGGDLQGNLQVADTATANNWHHVIASFTPSTPTTTGSIRGYLNGVLRYDITVPANSSHGTATGFNVGTFRDANGRWFDGAIDEVAIWNASLGAAEAYWVYNLGDRGFALSTPERLKADNLTALNAGGSWAGGTAPGAGDVITFGTAFAQAGPVGTGADLSVAGLRVTGGTGLVQIDGSGGFLETGALGIDMSAGGRDLTAANLRIGASQRWNIGSGATFTAGPGSLLSGAHAIEKAGAGTAILLGDATHTGGTTITAGSLQVGNGGTTGSLGGNVTNLSSLVFNRSDEATFTGTVSGTGTLTHSGTGTLVLTAAGTFTGNTSATAGVIRLGHANALQNSTLAAGSVSFDQSVASNTFNLGGLGGSGTIVLNNNAATPAAITLRAGGNNASTTFSGSLSGSGSLEKTGTGTLTLSGTGTFGGGIAITQGRLNATTAAALGSGVITAGVNTNYGTAYASGGTPFLALTGSADTTVSNALQLPDPAGTRFYAIQKSGTGSNLTLAGNISGGGANMVLQLDSPTGGDSTTTFTLSGNNTLSGQVRLNRGALVLTNAASLGSASLLVQTNANTANGNLRFGGSFNLPNNIAIAANNNTLNTGAHEITLSGVISGSASWNKIGGGSLTVTNSNTGTGPVTINEGTFRIGNGGSMFNTGAFFGTAGTNYVIVNQGTTLETRDWGYGDGNALNTLRANSSSVRFSGGTARFTETFSALRGFQVGPEGATLEAAAGTTYTKLAGSVASDNLIQGVSSAGSLTLTGAGDGVIHDTLGSYGSWSPSAGIIKSGTGTWTLTATNPYSGDTVISAGTLALGSSGSISNSNIILNGGNFNVSAVTGGYTIESGTSLSGSGSVTGDLTIDGALTIGSSPGTMSFDGDLGLNGTAGFEITDPMLTLGSYDLALGSGTVTFGGVLDLFFSGGTYADGATVQLFDFDGGYSGDFASINFTGLGPGQSATFDAATGFVTVIPEPAAALLGGLGLLTLLRRRRRQP